MSLKIFLLGQFNLLVNDSPIKLPSRPAQSLLAYLALNAGVTHRREKLASLLWPEAIESNARSYLRQALWRIRKSLESGSLDWEDFLDINEINVTFTNHADYWLDVDVLLKAVEPEQVEKLIETVSLYRGELLPGFYDEWIVSERDRLQSTYHQKMCFLLEGLIRSRKWHEAIEWGEKWVRLDYAPEPAYRAMMRSHAELGDLGMVHTTFQRCAEAIDRELSLKPSPDTLQLYEQICLGRLTEYSPLTPYLTGRPPHLPAFLDEKGPHPTEKPVFVARERELSRLNYLLTLSLAGQGRVVFITGEAGSGKTALLHEFSQRAQDAYHDLIIAIGNCNAHTGTGDPYLPFREILGMLTGDVEARWEARAITTEHAIRLWKTLPLTVQALATSGPDLINTFVPGSALIDRAAACMPGRVNLLTRINQFVKERNASGSIVPGRQQSNLFDQYTQALQSLARKVPLVLIIDDLQWADAGSIGLLFHLGRRLAGSRILIVGAYRPEEVALGRSNSRHPLEPVINELQREFGENALNLEMAERQGFIEAFLDSEPNRLGMSFRQMLYQQTHGHPLFTIELLRGMQGRGDLAQDNQGYWVEQPSLDWETLPARVEAVIAERIGRLAPFLQTLLRVASVEGEMFTAEALARVQTTDEHKILRCLSNELDRKHRLIKAQSILRINGKLLSCYRFQHIMFQKYLYSSLDPVERVRLHEEVGTALEELYNIQVESTVSTDLPATADIAVQLARHFQEAKNAKKAIRYLKQAGDRAVLLSAYQEGIAHLNQGMALLMNLPDSPERNQQELSLLLSLGNAWRFQGANPEGKKAFIRARELCYEMGKISQLSQVLGELSVFHYVQAEYHQAQQLGEEALRLAVQAKDPLLAMVSHWYLGIIKFGLGKYMTSRDHLEQLITPYKHEQQQQLLIFLRGSDTGSSALAYNACCLWCLGYPDTAMKQSQEALALARDLDHPFSLADVLCYGGSMLSLMRKDASELKATAEELIQLSQGHCIPGWLGMGICFRGEALIMMGKIQEGITQIQQGIDESQLKGIHCYLSIPMGFLAQAQAKAGNTEKGLTTLTRAIALAEQKDEGHWKAELYRLWAELLLSQGAEAEAETQYQKAITVARQQHAKMWELRSTIGLAHLWQKQGRLHEAQQMLYSILSWFTEGLNTPDLKEARALFEALS